MGVSSSGDDDVDDARIRRPWEEVFSELLQTFDEHLESMVRRMNCVSLPFFCLYDFYTEEGSIGTGLKSIPFPNCFFVTTNSYALYSE